MEPSSFHRPKSHTRSNQEDAPHLLWNVGHHEGYDIGFRDLREVLHLVSRQRKSGIWVIASVILRMTPRKRVLATRWGIPHTRTPSLLDTSRRAWYR